MKWDKNYRIGVTLIDDQHREWFRRVGRLGQAIEQGDTRDEMASILRYVVEYTQKHFADEQAYMRKHQYPGLESQNKLHKSFEQYIIKVLVTLRNGRDVPPAKLHEFMSNWMIQHIREEDLKIGEFMSQQDTGGDPEDETRQGDRDGLEAKLSELAELFETELITAEDFDAKKQDFVRQFAGAAPGKAYVNTIDKLDRLKAMIDNGLLTDEDLKAGRHQLAAAVNLARELAGQAGLKGKMTYLKRLFDEQIIDAERFESHKAQILGEI